MARRPARYLLLLVAALSLQLTGCSDDSPQADEDVANTEPAASEPAASESTPAEPTPTEPTATEAADSAPFSLRDYAGPIDPGRHRVPLMSWEQTYPVDAVVRVPAGFITPGGWVVENGLDGKAYGDLMFFGDVDRIDTDPCGAGGRVKIGPTVGDLADAVTGREPGWASSPEPVEVGGRRGLYVELQVPRDLSRCESGHVDLFAVKQADDFWYTAGPGSVVRLWIVDVDGERVAVAVKVVPGRTAHAGDLVHMAETAEFVHNVAQ